MSDPIADANAGHRARLRKRYASGGLAPMLDYEKLELVLTFLIPRRDTKPLAKLLIQEFKTLSGVLSQSRERLLQVPGVGESTATFLSLIKELGEDYLKSRVLSSDLLRNTAEAVRYARMKMGSSSVEEMLFIYTDSNGRVVKIENQYGSRFQLKPDLNRMVQVIANERVTGLILIHNHPGGNCIPSANDVTFTEKLRMLTEMLQVNLLDHIIVTHDRHCSLVGYLAKEAKDRPAPGRSFSDDMTISSGFEIDYVVQ